MSELESDLFWRPEALKVVRTQSPRMRQVLEKLKSVAPTRTTVLLLGDTGVGKGMIAKLIHQHSSRSDMPFVHLHCGAIPETLVESELFGYEKGAFTGANKRKLGRFDKAQGGTLFLDEVNTISPSTQIKLLQVLQERIFQRVGGEQPIEADVRIITASNSDLSALCEEGSFRRDLYYRLSVFPIQLPSLRERTEDIPQIIDSLIEWFNQHYFKDIQGIDPFVIKALKQYDWPGNVRELQNYIERAVVMADGDELTVDLLPDTVTIGQPTGNRKLQAADLESLTYAVVERGLTDADANEDNLHAKIVNRVERELIAQVMISVNNVQTKAAARLGINRNTLHKKLKEYNLES